MLDVIRIVETIFSLWGCEKVKVVLIEYMKIGFLNNERVEGSCDGCFNTFEHHSREIV
jgi:hypothetical protein